MLLISPNKEYPRYIGDLQLEHPDWKEGDPLPDGWIEVAYAETTPIPDAGEIVYEVEPTIIDGVLTQTFATRKMTDEEKSIRNARETAKEKLLGLGLTEVEIRALFRRM